MKVEETGHYKKSKKKKKIYTGARHRNTKVVLNDSPALQEERQRSKESATWMYMYWCVGMVV